MSTTENPNPTSVTRTPAVKTLEELSAWIEAELATLESRHEAFETKSSVRNYLKRQR